MIEHARRRILHFNVTRHPSADWVVQQLRATFPEAGSYRYVILDRDAKFDDSVMTFLRATALTPKRWREVIEGGHLELTSKFQAEDYIQHNPNPNANTGRAGFVEFVSKFAKPKNPIPTTLSNPPVVKGAKGDYVWLIFESEQKDPRDPSKTYHSNSFDVLRIENGKVQEHCDSAQRCPGAEPSLRASRPSPQCNETPASFPKRSSRPSP